MKKVAFHTLGCKVNQYETEAMEELFEKSGYQIVDFREIADIYVVNTCTVTNVADKKSRQMLSKAKHNNEGAIIVAVGCYAQIAKDKLIKDNNIDLVIGSNNKNKIVDLVEEYIHEGNKINVVEDIGKTTEYEDILITKVNDKTRAYIKIQDGCNQFCSYCIIPYTRGRIRSREMSSVIKEVNTLASNGYHEIVLTGIHIASYGKDLTNTSLIELLMRLNEIDGILRIRLGSLEPNLITEEFISQLSKLNKVCPHFHLSLQSGCDATLKRMNRKYTTEIFNNKVEIIRKAYENPSITTDIIVGFPGETDEEFDSTLDFVRKIRFSGIHVFKYSMREGTPAAARDDQIDPRVKTERSHTLTNVQSKIREEFLNSFINKEVEVLFEEESMIDEKKCYYGFTDNYIKVKVFSDNNIRNLQLSTKIIKIQNDNLVGSI
ncbi:tRNA (N(6)-L-threonylcarbamoyladenosine(37)-C(2))-methylthiotransferase MtaB [Vallitalea guaymasensis]|uniref:Threonylcarbamoyladenosine tRNA methylthiotransferase MtaB n=1 Tax=Vallitalea guaymasensis TaxID=1185412 RepID=A0A8J8MDU1_9FIRM|nr:tRNA (N(6)-L-threonylcarbamoyladenosine(37)-C(2))-methylthiotransferase MtaB [Vallitalea guaymasensis]QUH31009.1 tRNA (N(6)-L-threonylcarbamoyladenosine(37)-C(2))-methylthiotransferase MtaB [Vallitalea guaymasensis]